MTKINNNKTLTVFHIIIIILGILVYIGGCFQRSVWFDEAFTLGLIKNDFFDMIRISIKDVHPPLYYISLKLFCEVFGYSYPVYRIFSAMGAILLSVLGLTHIKKDFGEKHGIWFTAISIMFAANLYYALQIRMYTWAALFVALSAIYANRIHTGDMSISTSAKFVFCSVVAAYIHHFSLFAVCSINIAMLIHCTLKNTYIRRWWQNAICQIALFIPGAVIFLIQALSGAGGSWQTIVWPDLVLDFISYPMLGYTLENLFQPGSPMYIAASAFFVVLCGFLIVVCQSMLKNNIKNSQAVIRAMKIYFGLIIFTLIVSLFRVLYYIRYTMCIIPFLIFVISWILAGHKSKIIKTVIAVICFLIFSVQAVNIYKTVYDSSNHAVYDYLESKLEKNDIILFDHFNNYRIPVDLQENKAYYYHPHEWNPQAYVAFGTNTEIITTPDVQKINPKQDRIWVIGKDHWLKYMQQQKNYKNISGISIYEKYSNCTYDIYLFESLK